MSGNGRNGKRIEKEHPLKYMLKNFKRGFNGGYGVRLTPDKLRTFCKVD
jgi:hypothetical protein